MQPRVQEALQTGEHLLASLGLIDVAQDGSTLVVDFPVQPRYANSRGALQGGLIATLIDVVAGRLASDGLTDGRATATNDLVVHYLAPIVQGPARAEARVLRGGRRSMVVQVEVRDLAMDRLAAVGTVSFTVLEPLDEPGRAD
jgi:uncharacterized protein (TIGR00369 family)